MMFRIILLFVLFTPTLTQARPLCPQTVSEQAMNQCLDTKLERAVNELDSNLDQVRQKFAGDPDLLQLIELGQKNWDAYRKRQCQSVFMIYSQPRIQNLMTMSCAIQLARERNQILRETYQLGD